MLKKIQYLNSLIFYYVYGRGKHTVVCLHGYGSTGSKYSILEPYLAKDFTLLCIELPFHNSTRWNEHRMFYAEDLDNIISMILQAEARDRDIWLTGYSLGGRIAIDYFQKKPLHIKKIILLAPDGLHKIFWYWLIAETHFGTLLLNMLNKSSKWAMSLIKFFYSIKAINASIYVLAKEFLTDKEERKLLVKRWITFRKMHPNLKKFGKNLIDYNINTYVLFGSHDKVINPATIKYIKATAPNKIFNHTIQAGHILLREPHASEIAKLFYTE